MQITHQNELYYGICENSESAKMPLQWLGIEVVGFWFCAPEVYHKFGHSVKDTR